MNACVVLASGSERVLHRAASARALVPVYTEADEGGYMAFNPETGTTTQGETFHEAVANLREATELFLEEFPMSGKRPAVLTCFELSHGQTAGC